ncbi:MAG: SCO family protein [Chloroflexi bacterium]|nr:SCO family protein [Chloroflexota bacterium]
MVHRSIMWLGAGISLGLFLILGVTLFFVRPYSYHGTLYNPASAAADFALTDQNGEPFRLSAQQGNVVLLYFGYTHCPDECPATMGVFKEARSALGSLASRVQMVFITVDPQQDSPSQLKTFLAKYDSRIIGLTGSAAQLAPVWKAYGIYIQSEPQTLQPTAVTHSDQIFLIDPQGRLLVIYDFGVSPSDLVSDIEHILYG